MSDRTMPKYESDHTQEGSNISENQTRHRAKVEAKKQSAEIERLVEQRLAAAKKDIIRIVREQQRARYAARPKSSSKEKQHKSVRLLTLDALVAGAKSRDAIYQWIFKRLGAETDTDVQKKIANNVNINLHVLARARLIKKKAKRGGHFSLTNKGILAVI